jgi:hypothetical protein
MTQLTTHFSLEELYASEIADRNNIDNIPKDPTVLKNLFFVATQIRTC